MKKLLIVILILLLLVGAVLGFALLNANKLIAQLKPRLEQIASNMVGAQIQLDNITASILPQTALKVSGLRVKDAKEPGPSFDEFLLELNLKALLGGKLNITKISLVKPELTFIKDASGIRLRGLPIGKSKEKGAEVETEKSPASTVSNSTTESTGLPLEINLQGFELKQGVITLEDTLASKTYTVADVQVKSALDIAGETITIKALNLTASALGKIPLTFSAPSIVLQKKHLAVEAFSASLATAAVNGSSSIDLASMAGKVSINSPGIDIASMLPIAADFIPAVSQFSLVGTVSPTIEVKLLDAKTFSASGSINVSGIGAQQGIFTVSDLGGDFNFQASAADSTQLNTENLKFTLNKQPIAAKILGKLLGTNLSLDNFALQLLGGTVGGNLNLALNDSKAFTAKIQGAGINIEQALGMIGASASQISGIVEALNTSVNGSLSPNLMQSLRGGTTVRVVNGELKGFNLAGLVLKAVNNLPFLTGALYSSVPASERGSIDTSNTAFRSLDASINFEGSGIRANSVHLIAPIFTLDANGRVGFDKSLDLASTILFNQSFSSALVSVASQFKKVLDPSGQLVFPLKIQGTPPLVLVYPDLKKLIEVAGRKILTEKAGEAVRGLLEKKGFGGVGSLLGF